MEVQRVGVILQRVAQLCLFGQDAFTSVPGKGVACALPERQGAEVSALTAYALQSAMDTSSEVDPKIAAALNAVTTASLDALLGKADANALASLLSTVDGLDTPLEVDKIANALLGRPSVCGVGVGFFSRSAQRARGRSIFNVRPTGGVSFFNGLPNGPRGIRFSMVRPTRPGGFVFKHWFAQRRFDTGSPNPFRFDTGLPNRQRITTSCCAAT